MSKIRLTVNGQEGVFTPIEEWERMQRLNTKKDNLLNQLLLRRDGK